MIKTTAMILEELKDYKAPANKLKRLVNEGAYVAVARGIYETDRRTPGYLLAGSIYGPSYLSFEYALSYYGLIPEAVYVFTSATFKKKKKKEYENFFGKFIYQDIPEEAYPFGVRLKKEGEYAYLISSAEKALCDKLYTMSPVANKRELQELLFVDLRLDEEEFLKLNREELVTLCDLYHCTNLKMLKKLMR